MTGTQLVTSAMRLIQVLAAGEAPSADEAADGLVSAQTLFESWQGEELMLFESRLVSITLSTTFGPYALSGARPIKILGADVLLGNGLRFPVKIVGPTAFGALDYPDASPITKVMMCDYNLTAPQVYVAPIPTGSSTLRVHVLVATQTLTDGTTTIALPPNYLKALRYNLAVDLAPEYGAAVNPQVLAKVTEIAVATKANLVALNGSNRAGASQLEIPAIPAEASR